MKIISKFKDYYDYLQGIYGVDESIVYLRNEDSKEQLRDIYTRTIELPMSLKKQVNFRQTTLNHSILSIDDEFYYAIEWNGEIISNNQKIVDFFNDNEFSFYYINRYSRITIDDLDVIFLMKKHKNLNSKFNIPVIGLSCFNLYYVRANPFLEQNYNWITKVISPEIMYFKLSQFLSKKDIDVVNKPEDMLRFESKGFDKKSSFRNTK